MTKKEFFKRVAKEKKDLLADFIAILDKKKVSFCVIGGLAVNAYVEPVVSLDLDVVVVVERLEELLGILRKKYKVQRFPHSINISSALSDLRIQIQTNEKYQDFIRRAKYRDVLGYKLPVANVEDVIQGKIWAAQDETRRPSKRQKDLADIMRLTETHKRLISLVPQSLKKKLEGAGL